MTSSPLCQLTPQPSETHWDAVLERMIEFSEQVKRVLSLTLALATNYGNFLKPVWSPVAAFLLRCAWLIFKKPILLRERWLLYIQNWET